MAGTARVAKAAKCGLLVLASPVLVPVIGIYLVVVLPVMALAVGAFVAAARLLGRVGDRRRRRVLLASGRMMSWDDMLGRLPSGGGSFVLEELTLGWNDVDVWWTPDAVSRAGGPPPLDRREAALRLSSGDGVDTAFYRWCKERYCEPGGRGDVGRSYLVRMVRSHAATERLDAELGQLGEAHAIEVVKCWSAVIGMEQQPERP